MTLACLALGTEVFIGTTSPNAKSDIYTEICGVETIGDIAEQVQDRTYVELDQNTGKARILHARGEASVDLMEITCTWLPDDAGQAAVKAAWDSSDDDEYNVLISFSNGEDHYVSGPLMSFRLVPGSGPNAVLRIRFSMGVNRWQPGN